MNINIELKAVNKTLFPSWINLMEKNKNENFPKNPRGKILERKSSKLKKNRHPKNM